MPSIIDNRDDNTLFARLTDMSAGGRELCIASAFFSLDALAMLASSLGEYDRIRILFGDDASAMQRRRLLDMLRQRSDADLLSQREQTPTLPALRTVADLFAAGRVEARCYTTRKFHAKAYHIQRPAVYPPEMGVIGSGNFTRPGLTQNVELNVELTPEQTAQLREWYEERWAEARLDVVTEDVLAEVRRQIELYDPYILYLKALTMWGAQQERNAGADTGARLPALLDPHQDHGFRRALQIIDRYHGCMICDGVGLGKSFIALALMERYCREGLNVLLIAPKSILTSSWTELLHEHMDEYRDGWGGLKVVAMTDLGFPPEEKDREDTEPPSARIRDKRREVAGYWRSADVVVIDESHNFRASPANRYLNLYNVVAPCADERKKIVMLTATPINTAYRDIANQLALITHEKGNIAGYPVRTIRAYANDLDKGRSEESTTGQMSLGLVDTPSEALNRVLSNVVIQRSRSTVKALAAAEGKEVLFPRRNDPRTLDVTIGADSQRYADLVRLAEQRFEPTATYIRELRAEIAKADKKGSDVPIKLRKGPPKGIKLAAFLTEQYRLEPATAKKVYLDEVHLASLVFANTLKQLESSPVAFQGILQSLGTGLVARLRHVFGDAVDDVIAQHQAWLRTRLFDAALTADVLPGAEDADDEALQSDGESLDASGDEADAWIEQAVRSRGLDKKLRGFTARDFDVDRWRRDIEGDLVFLREVHAAALEARRQPDPKMEQVLPVIDEYRRAGRKVLLFTQSQRTSEYLERALKQRLTGQRVARIDSRVEDTRAAILHAFCPSYNPAARAQSIPAELDILISTDVLAEGVNLQDAGVIISYDIHWNPVRLIQRIGRVDRRIDPAKTPRDHCFDIVNVLPPDEINDIINLVGTVENRTLRISNALGLDVSFFKSTDPAGNLKEFNALCDGEVTATDRAFNAYARAVANPPDAATQAMLDVLPPGAFGVWDKAPIDGLFALFTMEANASAPRADVERFSSIVGRAVLALAQEGRGVSMDAGPVLHLLAGTRKGEHSGTPSDEATLARELKRMRDAVRAGFADIQLPGSIAPRLVCWMELRQRCG